MQRRQTAKKGALAHRAYAATRGRRQLGDDLNMTCRPWCQEGDEEARPDAWSYAAWLDKTDNTVTQ
jgi:hypothetical protein